MRSNKGILFSLPSKIFTDGEYVFLDYFHRKAILSLATHLTEDLMKIKGYRTHEIVLARDAIYLAISMLQGSLNTSGPPYCANTLLTCLGYSEDHAYWGGFAVSIAVSLALDFSPWGLVSTAISTIGGIAGKKCMFWGYKELKKTALTLFHLDFHRYSLN